MKYSFKQFDADFPNDDGGWLAQERCQDDLSVGSREWVEWVKCWFEG